MILGWRAKSTVFLVLSALAPLTLYWSTAAPGVTGTDSGELALACHTLGIAHAPGFPLYVLLGHGFSRLPVAADVARRLNLFSGFCGALACAMAFLLCRELLGQMSDVRKGRDRKRAAVARTPVSLDADTAAFAAALAFGGSLSLWSWAVLTEVYTLNILLIAVMLWMAARGSWRGVALAAGLGLGVHHVTVALALPAAAALLWTRRRPPAREWPLIAAMLLLGLASYLYLPLRAAQSPLLNWGDPSNWERFWWHITARQYRVHLFSAPLSQILDHSAYFLSLWIRQFTPLGFALACLGLWTWRDHRRLFWVTILLVVPNVAFTINYDIAEDIEGYYLPVFLAGTWCLARGAQPVVDWVTRRRPALGGLMVGVVFAVALAPAVVHFPANNRRSDRAAPLLMDRLLKDVPQDAIILTSDWQFYSPWLYRRHVEGLRPDLAVVDTLMMRRSWYLDMLERDYPDLARSAATEMAAFRRQLDLFEHDQPYDPAEIDGAFVALVRKMAAGRPQVFQTQKLERPFVPARLLPLAP